MGNDRIHILKNRQNLFRILIFLSLTFTFAYLVVRTTFFLIEDKIWTDKIMGLLLLVAELFALMHAIGYSLALWASLVESKVKEKVVFWEEDTCPPIAIVVPSYKEPLPIIRDALICLYNLTYPNKYLYLLDDTRYDGNWDTPENMEKYKKTLEEMCQWYGINLFRRKWRAAKAGIINDFFKFKKGEKLDSLQFFNFQNKPQIHEKYLVIFDADMNPFPDFVEPLVERMEKSPNAAFIQTPQYYSNFETNRVARAAGLQQAIFYEYICENKGDKNAVFCCGSNVLLRMEALNSLGGFDETSLTEDFSTSLQLHMKGWDSIYFNKILAFGMGPEDLGAYFKQQYRWALGTLNIAVKFPYIMFLNFRKMPLYKWWEYSLSATYYLTGLFMFIMIICPVVFVLFEIPGYFLRSNLYVAVFIPYLVFSLVMTFWTLSLRNYRVRQLIASNLIVAAALPVFIKATLNALFRIKSHFVVTPKGKSTSLSLIDLWPQVFLAFLCLVSIVWGLEKLYFVGEPFWPLTINVFWCCYNLLLISSVFYFNNPEGEAWVKS